MASGKALPVMTIAGGGGGSAAGTRGYRMSYNVAAMVRTDVTATARSAHDDHHGHDSSWISSGFAMAVKSLRHGCGSVE